MNLTKAVNTHNKIISYIEAREIKNALDAIAVKHNTHPATVALAWQLAQPSITASIVSATSKSQLQNLIDAPTLELDEEDLDILNEVSR